MSAKDQMKSMVDQISRTGLNDEEVMNKVLQYRGVFHSLDAVLTPLKSKQYAALPEVISLLNVHQETVSKYEDRPNTKRHLFIVLEGLDGSGKSTLTKRLANKLGGVTMSTPPKSISHLRETFDKHEPELRRAYYGLGNYIAAYEAKFITYEKPVVMDRFWNSTAAYAIGNEVKEGKPLPPDNSPLYEWPIDLLCPDYVIYLKVAEDVRLQRLSRRLTYTPEEDELKDNKTFRMNLEETYKRMKPGLHFVNGNSYPNTVIANIKSQVLGM